MTDASTRAAALLQDHRESIDRLDAILVFTLAERFKQTQSVGRLKAEHGLPASDPVREARQIDRRHNRKGKGDHPRALGAGAGKLKDIARTVVIDRQDPAEDRAAGIVHLKADQIGVVIFIIGEVIRHGQHVKACCLSALGKIDPRLAIWLR